MPNTDATRDNGRSERECDSAILNLLLCDPCPWTEDEFAREIGYSFVGDALDRLHGEGFVHRLNEFVWPTRTARRANELCVGSV
jgi:hypothetical protein